MNPTPLAPYQIELIERPLQSRIFLEGLAGSGKTTTGIGRMLALLNHGVPASSLLLLVPQRTLAATYLDALRAAGLEPGGQVSVLTVGGLARRMVDLFWPLVAEEAGFARPDQPPAFLTLETAQYYMAHLVRPLLEQGLFDSVTIDRNRLYSQVLDNLNKAAIVGFPYTEIGERLKAGLDRWIPPRCMSMRMPSAAPTLFREYCLQNNLLDFSLQMEIFCRHLWPSLLCREYLRAAYRHLIADNIEEDTPGRARPAARLAAGLRLGPADLRPGGRLPALPGRGPGQRPAPWWKPATSTISSPRPWSRPPRCARSAASWDRPWSATCTGSGRLRNAPPRCVPELVRRRLGPIN